MSFKSSSIAQDVRLIDRVREWADHFGMRWAARGNIEPMRKLLTKSVDEYEEVFSNVTGRKLRDARILEVGYGARPLRLMFLLVGGYDAWGVDLDSPVIRGTPAEFLAAMNRNGIQRVAKSLVRHFAFDRREWQALFGPQIWKIERDRFLVGDVKTLNIDSMGSNIDLIYSEDVFEHIPEKDMDLILRHLANSMSAKGCAIIRPNVFTGIGGGHLTEWYPHNTRTRTVGEYPRTEPWEHLRKKRARPNTYLNEMKLADYRRALSEYFDIVDELFHDLDLGSRFLSSQIEAELSEFSREDLLANTVRFVCVPKR